MKCLTRPSNISGNPVTSSIAIQETPFSCKTFIVPPVDTISVTNKDGVVDFAKGLVELGFEIVTEIKALFI